MTLITLKLKPENKKNITLKRKRKDLNPITLLMTNCMGVKITITMITIMLIETIQHVFTAFATTLPGEVITTPGMTIGLIHITAALILTIITTDRLSVLT